MITEAQSEAEDFEALRERLEQEVPNSNSTDREEIVAELDFQANQMVRPDVESGEEFLDDIEGTYEDNVSVRREWGIDRSGQEAGVPFENESSDSIRAEVPVNFRIQFDDRNSVLGFKDTLSDGYGVPNLQYKAEGEANTVSEAIEGFKNSERLCLRYNNFSVALQEKAEGWSIAGLEFEYNFRNRTIDPEKLKIPYKEIIEDVIESADDNGVDYKEEVFEEAADEHEENVEWATENRSDYNKEDMLNPE